MPTIPPPLEADEFTEHIEEVFGASVRAGVIVAVAELDNALARAIRSKLRSLSAAEEISVFKGAAAPLNTLSSKIIMAYALDIITDGAREDLFLLKDIRNAFAHERSVKSFDDPKIERLCRKILHTKHINSIQENADITEPDKMFGSAVADFHIALDLLSDGKKSELSKFTWQRIDYPAPKPPASPKKGKVRPSKGNPDSGRNPPGKGDPPKS